MLTVEQVRACVARIAELVDDDEVAHHEEDALRREVLLAIADRTTSDPAGVAAAALETGKLDFKRWCA